MSKNRMVLMSFVNYCAVNPDLRFWQALAAWSGYTLFAGNANAVPIDVMTQAPVKDTFFWEGHRG